MSHLIKPENYHALLDLQQTEIAIKKIKDFFLSSISTELRLRRVTAPLFVLKGLGCLLYTSAVQIRKCGKPHPHPCRPENTN